MGGAASIAAMDRDELARAAGEEKVAPSLLATILEEHADGATALEYSRMSDAELETLAREFYPASVASRGGSRRSCASSRARRTTRARAGPRRVADGRELAARARAAAAAAAGAPDDDELDALRATFRSLATGSKLSAATRRTRPRGSPRAWAPRARARA